MSPGSAERITASAASAPSASPRACGMRVTCFPADIAA
jgi:hypothetical protein